MEDLNNELAKEAKRLEEEVTYSAKGHFNDATFWRRLFYFLNIPSAILSAMAGVSALSTIPNHTIVAAIISVSVAILTGISITINPSKKGADHQVSGNKYNALKGKLRRFYNITLKESNNNELANKLESLGKEKDSIDSNSLPIRNKSYIKAKEGIENGQHKYKIDNS